MYNAQNYIGNCIESLLNQNIPDDDYEIIIIDDGSRDNSVAIVDGYVKSHKNIRLYKEPNAGAFTTRNKLLKFAKGNYIYNLDADDYVVHNCFEELLKSAEENRLDIIGFKTKETSDLSELNLNDSIESDKVKLCSGLEFIENHPLLRHEIWWYFIKRDFMLEHDMVFNTNEYNADVMFTLKALLKAKNVGYHPISIHRYVQTEDSLMRSNDFSIVKKRLEYIQMMIGNTSELINDVKGKHSNTLVINMEHRRDVFTFFNIINMIRNAFRTDYVKEKILMFKSVDAYPIQNFNRHRYNTFQYRILAGIINNEKLLLALISLKNIISRPKN